MRVLFYYLFYFVPNAPCAAVHGAFFVLLFWVLKNTTGIAKAMPVVKI